MDRRKKHELPKMQVGFINFVCLPLYKVLAELLPSLTYLHDGASNNREKWQLLVDEPTGVACHVVAPLHPSPRPTLVANGSIHLHAYIMHVLLNASTIFGSNFENMFMWK